MLVVEKSLKNVCISLFTCRFSEREEEGVLQAVRGSKEIDEINICIIDFIIFHYVEKVDYLCVTLHNCVHRKD